MGASSKKGSSHNGIFSTSNNYVPIDPMLTLPDGLEDGKSIVIYNSLEELVSKVLYYLGAEQERQVIALQGYKVAMGQHRSWHMMEKIVNHVLAV
jgi:spore maturation protein CgeB